MIETGQQQQQQQIEYDLVKDCEALDRVADRCYLIAHDHGFHEGAFNFGEKIALVHSELSEALEVYRIDRLSSSKEIPAFTQVEEELADAVIRIFDLAGLLCNCHLGDAIAAKIRYNKTRPYKHGKEF